MNRCSIVPFRGGPHLNRHEIHVVYFRLDCGFDDALNLLDDIERHRAARFVFDLHRRQFIAAHALTRLALGCCLDQSPASLKFAGDSHGKPRLIDPPIDLRFSLSHAGERALLALAVGREVGIDLEEHKPIQTLAIAQRFFSANECAQLQVLPQSEQIVGFYRCWTRKEAFVKALGTGLGFPLDAFDVDVFSDGLPQLLRGCRELPTATQDWRIVPLAADEGYSAALAAQAGDWTVARWLQPDLG